jgi:hypothetical protein
MPCKDHAGEYWRMLGSCQTDATPTPFSVSEIRPHPLGPTSCFRSCSASCLQAPVPLQSGSACPQPCLADYPRPLLIMHTRNVWFNSDSGTAYGSFSIDITRQAVPHMASQDAERVVSGSSGWRRQSSEQWQHGVASAIERAQVCSGLVPNASFRPTYLIQVINSFEANHATCCTGGAVCAGSATVPHPKHRPAISKLAMAGLPVAGILTLCLSYFWPAYSRFRGKTYDVSSGAFSTTQLPRSPPPCTKSCGPCYSSLSLQVHWRGGRTKLARPVSCYLAPTPPFFNLSSRPCPNRAARALHAPPKHPLHPF